MEISLFEDNAEIRVERCVLYPYPDLKRIWARLWITPTQDDNKPNLEVIVLNPDDSENCSVYLMAHAETRAETTLHMHNPIPGALYRVAVELTQGIGDAQQVLDRQTFEMALEFRNPEAGEPGFGFGVDWDEVARKASHRE
ncbi:MAG: hypothetical protein R6W76_12210 [Caldilinea sp.]